MQTVSNTFLTALRETSKSLSVICEFYHPDALPGQNGFDPGSADFLLGMAAVSGISFRGQEYKRLIAKNGIGKITKTINKELSGFNLTLSNSSLEILDFEDEIGFEGLICVVRAIDRRTSVNLDDSMVLFTGRCEPPDEFSKADATAKIKVKQILNQTELQAPRRTFSANDILGRAQSDPEFEGFVYTPRGGNINYNERVNRGGLAGVLALKKTVARTQPYSSHWDLQEETAVPIVLGRVPAQLINFVSIDRGTQVAYIGFWGDGHEYGFASIENIRSVTENFPIIAQTTKLGKRGGPEDDAFTQTNDDPNFVGGGTYSRTAYTRAAASGTTVQTDDGAPRTAAMIYGQKMPVPNAAGAFTKIDWSDSAVCQSRWMLGSNYYFKLADAWHSDEENLEAYNYGNHVLVDQHNTDTVLLGSNQSPFAGEQYKILKSTGFLSPEFFKYQAGAAAVSDAFGREADYQFYGNSPVNSDDWAGTGSPQMPPTSLRRRFTSNLQLLEKMNAIEFLFDIVHATSNLYLVQKANGKFAHRNKKPEDFTFIRIANAAGASSIEVLNINPWIAKKGKILIGATLPTSEVRTILGARFSPAGNGITVSASGGLSASAATLSGATDATPAQATLIVTSEAGVKNYSIAGFALAYSPAPGETPTTAAAFIASQINSHELLNKQIKAVWNKDATVTVSSRLGILDLDSPLEFSHLPEIPNPAAARNLNEIEGGTLEAGTYLYAYSYLTREGETITSPITSITTGANKKIEVPTIAKPARVLFIRHYFSTEKNGVRRRLVAQNAGETFYIESLPKQTNRLEPIFNTTSEELHRVAFVFTDKGNTQTGLSRSNVLTGTFTLPSGGQNKNYNQAKGKFRDAAADYKLTTLIINDEAKQAKTKKPIPLEVNLAGVDNEHQARRILNSRLAEASDGNKFIGLTSDNEALLIEENDVICCTDQSGRLVNEPARVEQVSLENATSYLSIKFVARKYRRYYFDDQVSERLVPLPIVANTGSNTETDTPTIYQLTDATNTTINVEVTNYTATAQFRRIHISATADFAALLVPEIVHSALNEIGQILTPRIILNRNTNLANSETRYVRVAHSSNGKTFGAWSNVLPVGYKGSDGSGGTGGGTVDTGGGDGTSGGGGGGGELPCFTGGTYILTASGTKPISDIKAGDTVQSFASSGKFVLGTVAETFVHTVDSYLELVFSDGAAVETTPEHPFLMFNNEFRAAGNLQTGDRVKIKRCGAWASVYLASAEIITPDAPVLVYNFHVAEYQHYFAGGFAVHNLKRAPTDAHVE